MSTENRIFMVFSAFYLIMSRYWIGLRCIILLDCYIMNKESSLRACLKNHSHNLHAPLCGIFHPNSVAVARYGALIRAKYPTNCDAHLA